MKTLSFLFLCAALIIGVGEAFADETPVQRQARIEKNARILAEADAKLSTRGTIDAPRVKQQINDGYVVIKQYNDAPARSSSSGYEVSEFNKNTAQLQHQMRMREIEETYDRRRAEIYSRPDKGSSQDCREAQRSYENSASSIRKNWQETSAYHSAMLRACY